MQKSKNRITSDSFDFLKEILDAMCDGVYIVNHHCDIEYVNPVILKEFGEPGKQKCFEYFHGRSNVCPWCMNKEVFKGKSVKWQWFNARTGRTYDLFDTPLRNPDGSISKLEFFHDVTDLKRAEEGLRVSETKYRTLFESLPVGITVSDDAGNILEGNLESERLLGISEEEQARRTLDSPQWRVIRPDGSTLPLDEYASVRALKEQRLVENVEMGIVKENGEVTWINLTAAPLHLKGYGVVITYSDISARRTAELKLHESAAFLDRMIEQSPTPTWISDDKGTLLRINKACLELLNITEQDVIGKYNVLKDNIVEEQGHMPLVRNVFEKGEVARFELKYDTSQLKHLALETSAHVFLDVTIFPVIDVKGKITNAVIQHIDITRRKIAEEALLKGEERYRTLVNNAAEGIFVVQDGKIVYSNPKAVATFGPLNIDGQPRNMTVSIHPDDRSMVVERYQRRLKGEQFQDVYPVRLIDIHGNTIWAQISSVRISWEDRPAILTFFTDITERKQAEEKIRESELLYRSLVETSPDAIGLMDLNGNIITYNMQAQEVFGFEPTEDLKGRNIMDLVAPENYQEILDNMQRILDEGTVRNLELRSYKKDGRPFYIELSSSLLRDKEGKPVSAIVIFKDITRRKKAEAVLQESETRYRSLFDHMLNGVAYCQMLFENDEPQDFIYLAVNSAFEQLTGLKDVSGKKVTEVIPGVRESNPELFEIYGRVSVTGKPERFETYIDSLGIWLSISVYSTEMGYFVALFDNVTERKLAEQKLEKSYEGMKKTLNDAINMMAKIVEMRDPYTAGHQKRVADLSVAIAREMKLDEDRTEQLRMAAVIHDIGKIYVPSDILSKPGKLGNPEFQLVKTHSQYGYEVIKGMDFPCAVAQAVLQHHERQDGSGYPGGLKDGAILLEAKILAVADVVEAMASDRPYRPSLGSEKALEEISLNRGRLYDPRVVDACLKLFKEKSFQF